MRLVAGTSPVTTSGEAATGDGREENAAAATVMATTLMEEQRRRLVLDMPTVRWLALMATEQ